MLKYEAVLNDLAEKIDNGTYKPNQQLPTIAELCGIYSVSNITIKKALDELALRGMISKRKGSGCYVKGVFAKTASVGQMSGQMAGFSSEAAAKGGTLTSDVLDFSVVHPEAPVAEKLGMSEEDFVYHVCRVRVLDGVPQVVEYTYMPIAKIPGLRLEHVQSSIYAYIEQDLGLKIDSAHRVVRAKMPTAEEKKELGLDGKTPVLEVEQVGFLDDGEPFEDSISRHAGDRYDFNTVAKH